MHPFPLFIVELQTAKIRLLRRFKSQVNYNHSVFFPISSARASCSFAVPIRADPW
jgi:hypothetical protein